MIPEKGPIHMWPANRFVNSSFFSGCRKRGSSFRGVCLHDGFGGFDGLGGSGKHLRSFCLSYKIQYQDDGFDGFGGFGGHGGFGRDGYPP